MTGHTLTRTRFAQVPIDLLEACATRKGVVFVYAWLWHYAGRDDQAWPSIDRLASECHMRPDDVRAAIRWLADQGWLTRIDRPGRTTLYRVRAERPEHQEVTPPPNGGSPKQGTTPLPRSGEDTPPPNRGDEQEARTRTKNKKPPICPPGGTAKGSAGKIRLSPDQVPDDLARVAEQLCSFWNDHKAGARTQRALSAQLTHLRKIRDDSRGGLAAVQAQLALAIESGVMGKRWQGIKHDRWLAFGLAPAERTATPSRIPAGFTPADPTIATFDPGASLLLRTTTTRP